MADKPLSVIETVTRDLNRTMNHGARALNKDGESRPLSMLTGQETTVANAADLKKKIQFRYEGNPAGQPLAGHIGRVDKTAKSAEEALKDTSHPYFKLEGKTSALPKWIYRKKTFSLPEPGKRTVEEEIETTDEPKMGLHLPAVTLRELDLESGAEVTLQRVITVEHPDKSRERQFRVIPCAMWHSGLLLRCPVIRVPEPNGQSLLVELKGVPQGERAYLDDLGLLPNHGAPRGPQPKIASLEWHIEWIVQEEGKRDQLNRKATSEWTMVRRNLTTLARPGEKLLFAMDKAGASYPYVATDKDLLDGSPALQLLQMASIANSRGYFFRAGGIKPGDIPENVSLTLIAAVKFERESGTAAESVRIPVSANAIFYQKLEKRRRAAAPVPEVLQFEGDRHRSTGAYTPAGCVSFALRRELQPLGDENESMHEAAAFARSVDLVDFEVSDEKDGPITYLEKGIMQVSAADKAAPLSPVQDLVDPNQQANILSEGAAFPFIRPALNMNAFTEALTGAARLRADPDIFYYRTTLRYAPFLAPNKLPSDLEGLYMRLKDPKRQVLNIKAGFRDLFGNRVKSGEFGDSVTLYYTDALIAPADWPDIDFHLEAVKSASTEAHARLVVRHSALETMSFYDGDVDAVMLANRLNPVMADDWFADLLYQKLSTATKKLLATPNDEKFLPLLLADLNRVQAMSKLLDDPVFDKITLSPEARRLRKELQNTAHPLPGRVRFLNRLLLEDGLGASCVRRVSRDETAPLEKRKKLYLIREQLRGAEAEDVTVTLRSEQDVDADKSDRAPYKFTLVARDLRADLIAFLDAIIAQPDTRMMHWDYIIEKTTPGVTRLAPALFIERKKFLPPDLDLPWVGDNAGNLRTQVKNETAKVLGRVAIVPAPPQGLAGADSQTTEFSEAAKQFQSEVAKKFTCQVGIARNRFNEHELWCIPNECFPIRTPGASPTFATARPLRNVRGNGTYRVPIFTKHMPQCQGDDCWEEFQLEKRSYTKLDYDQLGRRVFGFLEEVLQPTEITGAHVRDIWEGCLGKKDQIASILAGEDKPKLGQYVVPVFATDQVDQLHLRKISADLFSRDLRNFYRVDTMLQAAVTFPVTQPAQNPLHNFYGTIDTKFVQAVKSENGAQTIPEFSDFVLSRYDRDSQRNGEGNKLTISYDLPAGEEWNWDKWTVEKLMAKMTHVQFADADASGEFERGQWLELIQPELGICQLNLLNAQSDALTIPVVIRTFPTEPILQQVGTVEISAKNLDQIPHESLRRWDWQIDYLAPGAVPANDKITLDVVYPPEPSSRVVALSKDQKWKIEDLLHCLVVLASLADEMDMGPTPDHRAALLHALTLLLCDLVTQLSSDLALLAEPLVDPKDTFRHKFLNTSTYWPGTTPAPGENTNSLVKKVYYGPVQGSPNHRLSSGVPDPARRGTLSLFGDGGVATRCRPSLSLSRNEDFAPLYNMETNPELVYRCGPVTWDSDVEIRNVWAKVSARAQSSEKIRAFIQRELEAILGMQFAFEKLTLRVDARHIFDRSGPADIASVAIFPIDYAYTTLEALANDITLAYGFWLAENNDTDWSARANAVLETLKKRNPRLHLGLQVSHKSNESSRVGRVLLEIEILEFELTDARF